jgi:pimeloyl-ACP methyl ester carboxylesterase
MTRKKWFIGCGVLVLIPVLAVSVVVFLLFHRVKGEYFDSKGVKIHYTVEGKGEPLILVHGLEANADLNWRWSGINRALRKHFTVISFDLRGHGLSDKPRDPVQYGMEMTEDVVRLMDHLKIPKAHVAGYSLGGFIVVKLILAHPDRVISAAVCGAGYKRPDEPGSLNPLEQVPDKKEATTNPVVRFVKKCVAAVIEFVRSYAESHLNDRAATAECKKTLAQYFDVDEAALRANKVPTACFIGTRDQVMKFTQALVERLGNSEFHPIEGADHITPPMRSDFKQGLVDFFMAHRMNAK